MSTLEQHVPKIEEKFNYQEMDDEESASRKHGLKKHKFKELLC